jgi:hypothetical protein
MTELLMINQRNLRNLERKKHSQKNLTRKPEERTTLEIKKLSKC